MQAERPDVIELLSQMALKRQLELQHQQHQQLQHQQHQHQLQHQQHQHQRLQQTTPSWSDDPRQTSPEVGATTSEDDSSRRYNGSRCDMKFNTFTFLILEPKHIKKISSFNICFAG